MIRFIRIGGQITEESDDFAFYDTVIDKFITIAGTQVFDSRKEFEDCCFIEREHGKDIDEPRLYRLIPKDIK